MDLKSFCSVVLYGSFSSSELSFCNLHVYIREITQTACVSLFCDKTIKKELMIIDSEYCKCPNQKRGYDYDIPIANFNFASLKDREITDKR